MTGATWLAAGAASAWGFCTVIPHALAASTGLMVTRAGRHPSAVGLTFDDGPHREHTPAILDALERHGAKGTFFVLGRRVQEAPEVLWELVERGHEIALHGMVHRHPWFSWPWAVVADLVDGVRVLEDIAGVRPRYYRPPWGLCSLAGLVTASRARMRTVLWAVRSEGYFWRPTAVAMAEHIARAVRSGDVVGLHDAGGFPDTPARVAECLELLVPRLAASGLRCVTLTELLAGA